jgi:DNA-binding response OmpR family regulator
LRSAVEGASIVGTRRLLCVEDDEPTRAVMAAALRAFAPVFVANGHDAVLTYSASPFDAFVLDVRLPDYNGISLCRDIRRIDPHVPIVLWTIAEDAELRAWASDAGATTYLQKTSCYERLYAAVVEALQAAEQRFEPAGAAAAKALATAADSYRRTAAAATEVSHSRAARDRAIQEQTRSAFVQAGGTLRQFEQWWAEQAASAIPRTYGSSDS